MGRRRRNHCARPIRATAVLAGVAAAAGMTLLVGRALAEDSADDEAAMLELLLDAKVDVATRTSKSMRETPAVVTLVTRDEIAASGARTLADVLMTVPGFGFGVDVGQVVGVGFRGNWGHEGKVLLRIDGLELNETLYSTLQFGNHFPVDEIERVEIIRGPGSVIYGGYAELAVINVVSRKDAGGRGGGQAANTRGGAPP